MQWPDPVVVGSWTRTVSGSDLAFGRDPWHKLTRSIPGLRLMIGPIRDRLVSERTRVGGLDTAGPRLTATVAGQSYQWNS